MTEPTPTWAASVRYNNNPVLREYSGGTFGQIRTELVADLHEGHRLRKVIETDSFIEYEIVWWKAGVTQLVGFAEIEEMKNDRR